MTSRIGAMYQEARNTVRSAPVQRIENFLTEMLSLAVLADWRPMAELLSTVDAVRDRFLIEVERIRPYTQQQIVAGDNNFNRGRVDLVLAIDRNDGGADEVWTEVKAGSPFSGDQLDRYLKAIADAEAAKDRTCRRLIVLGPSGTAVPERYRDRVPVLTWATLVRTVQEASEASPLWIDFADFLLEAPGNLVPRDPRQEPVLSAEWIAGAITVALKDPVAWCNWERGRLLTRIRRLQSELGRPCIRRWAPWQMTYVELGSTREHPGSLSVRLCVAAHYGIPYEALWRRAQASGLSDHGWSLGTRRREEDVILETRHAFLEGEPTVDAAGAWMRSQLESLRANDLLLNLDGDGAVRTWSEHAPTLHELAPTFDEQRR
jgi:hypothetical protein